MLPGDSSNGWQSLSGVKTGIYNLLDLVNDKDTLLADASIPAGKIHQIRLVLGSNNTIVVDGESFPLETPSAEHSGLKLNIQQNVKADMLYTVLLDFDVAKSIVETGNSKFILKPVIRTILQAAGGSIKGILSPDSLKTAVFALQGLDTIASTYTGINGGYVIKGLNAGNYSLHYLPEDSLFQSAVKDNVAVTVGNVTIVDTLTLLQ